MAEQAGYLNEVWVLAGSTPIAGGTGAKILGVDNSSFNKLCEMFEINSFGDTYKKRVAGIKDNNMNISGNLYTGDTTGQEILTAGASIYIGTYPQGSTVAGTQMPAIVENFEVSADATGKQTFSCSLVGNGAAVAMPART